VADVDLTSDLDDANVFQSPVEDFKQHPKYEVDLNT